MNGVNELDAELRELKSFIADLKADRAAQKEKEKREAWTKYTSLSLVFIAVLAAVATQWAGKYSSRVLVELNNSTFYQAKASDQWSYYQAKSIKQNLYEALGETQKHTDGVGTGEASPAEAFKAKAAKYSKEEADIKKQAEESEKTRDQSREAANRASRHGSGMGDAIAIFQIAIALGSICLVTKKRQLWYLSMVLATLATLKMIQVWMT